MKWVILVARVKGTWTVEVAFHFSIDAGAGNVNTWVSMCRLSTINCSYLVRLSCVTLSLFSQLYPCLS